jgi:hypothetical protein
LASVVGVWRIDSPNGSTPQAGVTDPATAFAKKKATIFTKKRDIAEKRIRSPGCWRAGVEFIVCVGSMTMKRSEGNRANREPLLSVERILEWADAYHAATGHWPTRCAGPIRQAPFDYNWRTVDRALVYGFRGLPGGSSLARLLQQERGLKVRVSPEMVEAKAEQYRALLEARRNGVTSLSVEKILAWAGTFHAANQRWPNFRSGPIAGVPGETWSTINAALRDGRRGLPGGTTLARVLVAKYGRAALNGPPELSVEAILSWADTHHAAHGRWPTEDSGAVAEAPSESWNAVSMALLTGLRGLPGGSSLARLLAEHRGVRNPKALPQLSLDQILAWADAHHAATGNWPSNGSGPVRDMPGEAWNAIDMALTNGFRGLPGGSSLARLLDERRPERLRILTLETIREWAEAYRRRHGLWPSATSGPVAEAHGERWLDIDEALKSGSRGLPARTSLARLFGPSIDPALRGKRPRLTLEQVLAWGDAHHRASGQWPDRFAGAVAGVPGERWVNIDQALRRGVRGLPAGLTLVTLFERRPVPPGLDQSGEPGPHAA